MDAPNPRSRLSSSRLDVHDRYMSVDEIRRRLAAMGFAQVDDTEGWRPAFKWRHRSAFGTQSFGSVWVLHSGGEIHAVGTRQGGYRRVLCAWVKPTRVDTSLRNPFAVWQGKDLARLLDEMERRVSPSTTWPLA